MNFNTQNNVNQWWCSSCSTLNSFDQEQYPCTNCHVLDSQNNLKRAKALYLLGNISKPSVNLIPLKKPFFIYPLAAPFVRYRSIENTNSEVISVDFSIDIYDIKRIEKYHIERVKFDVRNNKESFVIHSLTPYCNIFTKTFNKREYNGIYTIDICLRCYGSDRVSPKQTIQVNLCHVSNAPDSISFNDPVRISPSSNNNNNNNNTTTSLIGLTSDLQVDDQVFIGLKDFTAMSVKELKDECRKYRFYVTGNKSDLVWRLKKPLEYIKQRKREYHTKKYGKSKRLIFDNYIWKNGKIVEKKKDWFD